MSFGVLLVKRRKGCVRCIDPRRGFCAVGLHRVR
jgi:hypothetical protein